MVALHYMFPYEVECPVSVDVLRCRHRLDSCVNIQSTIVLIFLIFKAYHKILITNCLTLLTERIELTTLEAV